MPSYPSGGVDHVYNVYCYLNDGSYVAQFLMEADC
jgi:hypothetical protein